jgi:hypothetical protein
MKRTLLAVALLSAQVIAQTTTPSSSIAVIGCVSRAVQTGSLTGAPGVPPATPETAPALANSQEPTGQLVLEGAKPADARGNQAAKTVTYVLDGKTAELEGYVGQQVEVTGSLRTSETGMSSVKTQFERLNVASLKPLGQCPKPGAPQQR